MASAGLEEVVSSALNEEEEAMNATLRFKTRQYEREDVQKKTFTKWINAQLSKAGKPPIEDLFQDLKDGTQLLLLLEVLTGRTLRPERGKMRVHHLNNVNTAIQLMEYEYSVKLVNISSDDIVEGNPKLTLGLVWNLVLNIQMKNMLKDRKGSQMDLERTLLDWCQHATKGYTNVSVTNFTTSFRDGLAFNALLHHYQPKLFDFNKLLPNDCETNLEHAFRLAQEKFGIERILDAEDVNVSQPDKKSIMMYVMCYFQVLARGRFNPTRPLSGTDFPQVLSRAPEPPTTLSPDLLQLNADITSEDQPRQKEQTEESMVTGVTDVNKFQESLEIILTWLLEAKDMLDRLEEVSSDVQKVKEQFQEHEEFMVELTQHQTRIGQILQRGNQLIREQRGQSVGSTASTESTGLGEEVSAQMSLLNAQWEELRTRAVGRQTDLQQTLTTLQQKQLDDLSDWLNKMEQQVNSFTLEGASKEGLNLGSIQDQITQHKMLQDEVERQQDQVIGLHNMVVVVDETNSDEAYTTLEKQLEGLGQRWGNVCRWVEQHWLALQSASESWDAFVSRQKLFSDWLTQAERRLSSLSVTGVESNSIEEITENVKTLRAVEREMDEWTPKFDEMNNLCAELELFVSNHPQSFSYLNDSLKTLHERWDTLVEKMEACSLVISKSGVQLNEVKSSDGSHTITVTRREQQIVESVSRTTTVTMVSSSEAVQRTTVAMTTSSDDVTAAKRSRLDEIPCERLNEELATLSEFLKTSRASMDLMSSQWLDPTEQLELIQEIEREEADKSKTLSQLSQSASTNDEAGSETEKALAVLEADWRDMSELLTLTKRSLLTRSESAHLREELTSLRGILVTYESMLQADKTSREQAGDRLDRYQTSLQDLQPSKDRLDRLNDGVRQLNESVKQLAPSSQQDAVAVDVRKLNDELEELNKRWAEMLKWFGARVREAEEEVKEEENEDTGVSATDALELTVLLTEERVWLNQLEALLAKGPKPTADAEEISEELDELENFVGNRKTANEQRIKNLSAALLRSGGLTDSAASDLKKYEARNDHLVKQAKDRLWLLEESIADAQNRESQIIDMQQWMADVTQLLQARLDADILAGDVPKEFDSLREEFEHQQKFVAGLEVRAEEFRSDKKIEAADRLDQQISLLKKHFDEVSAKFRKFQRPQDFDSKLTYVRRVLNEIDEKFHLLALMSDDPETVQSQLDQCMKFYKTMSEIKPDVEYVIKTGRQVVDRKQVDFPNKLNSQIDAVKQQYNELGAQITRSKCDLEKALKISKRLQKELLALQSFIDSTSDRLILARPAVGSKTEEELDWIKSMESEMTQKHKVIGALRELALHLSKLCEESSLEESPEASIARLSDALYKLDEGLIQRREEIISSRNDETVLDSATVTAMSALPHTSASSMRTGAAAADAVLIDRWLEDFEVRLAEAGEDSEKLKLLQNELSERESARRVPSDEQAGDESVNSEKVSTSGESLRLRLRRLQQQNEQQSYSTTSSSHSSASSTRTEVYKSTTVITTMTSHTTLTNGIVPSNGGVIPAALIAPDPAEFADDLLVLLNRLDKAEQDLLEATANADKDRIELLKESLDDVSASITSAECVRETALETATASDRNVIVQRWNHLQSRYHQLSAERATAAAKFGRGATHSRPDIESRLKDAVSELSVWLNSTETELNTQVCPADRAEIERLLKLVKLHESTSEDMEKLVYLLNTSELSNDEKDVLNRDNITLLCDRYDLAVSALPSKRRILEEKLSLCSSFTRDVDSLLQWTDSTSDALKTSKVSANYDSPSAIDPQSLHDALLNRQPQLDRINKIYDSFLNECRTNETTVPQSVAERITKLNADWSALKKIGVAYKDDIQSDMDITDGYVTSEPERKSFAEEVLEATIERQIISASAAIPTQKPESERVTTQQTDEYSVSKTTTTTTLLQTTTTVQQSSEVVATIQPVSQTPISPPSTSPLPDLEKFIVKLDGLSKVIRDKAHSPAVTVGDMDEIRDAIDREQRKVNELQGMKPHLDAIVVKSEASKLDQSVTEEYCRQLSDNIERLYHDWEASTAAVIQRLQYLETMQIDCTQFNERIGQLEKWVMKVLEECSRQDLGHDIVSVEENIEVVKSLQMEVVGQQTTYDTVHASAQRLMDEYNKDDVRKIKANVKQMSRLWAELYNKLNDREKTLRAHLNALSRFDADLRSCILWLTRVQLVLSRKEEFLSNSNGNVDEEQALNEDLRQVCKDLESEMASQQVILESVNLTGRQVVSGSLPPDSTTLQDKLDEMNHRWTQVKAKYTTVRRQIEPTYDSENGFSSPVSDLINWLTNVDESIERLKPVGGDLTYIRQQREEHQEIIKELEDKEALVEQTLKEIDTNSINGQLLESKWSSVQKKSDSWQNTLDEMYEKMQQFQENLSDISQQVADKEREAAQWQPVADVYLENLQSELDGTQRYQQTIAPLQGQVDQCNDMANQFTDIILSHRNVNKLEDLNRRWKTLQTSVENRLHQLENAIHDFGPNSQYMLSSSVEAPWERTVAPNKVPYYINHKTESTHWDHPEMTKLMHSLVDFNTVRFSAYRTSMKLRQLQKSLHLDMLRLEAINEAFSALKQPRSIDSTVSVVDMMNVLLALYVPLSSSNQQDLDIPLTVDLVLNWLLNVYDSGRSGLVRAASFKIAVVLMCGAHHEEKYKYIFHLMAGDYAAQQLVVGKEEVIDSRHFQALLHSCILIPKQLGEVAAFGGSNVEPSVKSCFETTNSGHLLDLEAFLKWMKLEPQSLVWLPVMHRLASAESARHQAKCSTCKQSPIVGLRYRCLKCFSVDLCQKCFFSGSAVKGHKLTHPMQEYCNTATSGEDMRDLTKVFKNKFRSKRYFQKHQRLGYLPVQSLMEGESVDRNLNDYSSMKSKEYHHTTGSLNISTNHSLGSFESASKSATSVLTHHTERQNGQMSSPSSVRAERVYPSSTLDGHSRVEVQSLRLAEAERRNKSSFDSNDEHAIIAQYCRNLHQSKSGSLKSPLQIMEGVETQQQTELESMIKELEIENRTLQGEYERLCQTKREQMSSHSGDGASSVMSDNREIEEETRQLEQHKGELEVRMKILEDHNRQLEGQLKRLRVLLDQPETDTRIVTFPTSQPTSPGMSSSSSHNSLSHREPPSFNSGQREPPSFHSSQHQYQSYQATASPAVLSSAEFRERIAARYAMSNGNHDNNNGNDGIQQQRQQQQQQQQQQLIESMDEHEELERLLRELQESDDSMSRDQRYRNAGSNIESLHKEAGQINKAVETLVNIVTSEEKTTNSSWQQGRDGNAGSGSTRPSHM